MSFCENCISYDMCNYEYEHCDTDVVLTFFPNNTDCPWFKNKADFVEVVRCKDCRHCEDYDEQDEYGWYHCAMHEMPTKLEHFCNFGERKDT